MARHVPKDVQNRVFSIQSIRWIGKPFKKAIIDDIEHMKKESVKIIRSSFEIILVTASFTPKTVTDLWQLFGETDEWGYCPDCDRPDCDSCDQRMPDEPSYNEGYM